MEKALSLDNVFVFTLIFAALAVPREEQPRLLLYGILAALVLRGVFIFAGAEALEQLQLGRVAVRRAARLHGLKILRPGGRPRRGRRRSSSGSGAAFPRRSPALLALLAIAFADVLFAVDSVPAILAITTDTFVVFAANAFALMGLRALFFLVAGLVTAVRVPAGRPRRAADRHRRQARLRRADRGEDPHHRDARLDRRRS